MIAKLNGMTEEEINNKLAEIYEESRRLRSLALLEGASEYRMMLLAIDDARFNKMSPAERKNHHRAAGLIPYDDSLYTDAAVREWDARFSTPKRIEMAKMVIFQHQQQD